MGILEDIARRRAASYQKLDFSLPDIPPSPPPKAVASFGDRVTDFGADILKVPGSLVEAGAGLANLPFAPLNVAPLEGIEKAARGVNAAIGNKMYSDARKQEEAAVQQAFTSKQDAGLWEQLKAGAGAAIDNPAVAVGHVPTIIAEMFAGSKGLKYLKPAWSALKAGAVGEGAIAAGHISANVGSETDEEFRRLMALPAGAATAAIPMVGGSLLGKMAQQSGMTGRIGRALDEAIDPETLLAGGTRSATGSLVQRMAAGGFREGVLEELPQSFSESVMSNVALDKPWMQGAGVDAGYGAVLGAGFGAGFNIQGQPPPGPEAVAPPPGGRQVIDTPETDHFTKLTDAQVVNLRNMVVQRQQPGAEMHPNDVAIVELMDRELARRDAVYMRDQKFSQPADTTLPEAELRSPEEYGMRGREDTLQNLEIGIAKATAAGNTELAKSLSTTAKALRKTIKPVAPVEPTAAEEAPTPVESQFSTFSDDALLAQYNYVNQQAQDFRQQFGMDRPGDVAQLQAMDAELEQRKELFKTMQKATSGKEAPLPEDQLNLNNYAPGGANYKAPAGVETFDDAVVENQGSAPLPAVGPALGAKGLRAEAQDKESAGLRAKNEGKKELAKFLFDEAARLRKKAAALEAGTTAAPTAKVAKPENAAKPVTPKQVRKSVNDLSASGVIDKKQHLELSTLALKDPAAAMVEIERIKTEYETTPAKPLPASSNAPVTSQEAEVPLTDEQRAAAGQVKKTTYDADGNPTTTWETSDARAKRKTKARTTSNEIVNPDDIANETHAEGVRMFLAGSSLREIVESFGGTPIGWSNRLAKYGYINADREKAAAAEGAEVAGDEVPVTKDDAGPAEGADASKNDVEMNSSMDEEVENTNDIGVNVTTKPNAGGSTAAVSDRTSVREVNAAISAVPADTRKTVNAQLKSLGSSETKLGSHGYLQVLQNVVNEQRDVTQADIEAAQALQKALQAKVVENKLEQQRKFEASAASLAADTEVVSRTAEKAAAGDKAAATNLFAVLGGENGTRLMQLLRTRFAVPSSLTAPKDVVQFLLDTVDRNNAASRAAADRILNSPAVVAAEAAWNSLPGTTPFSALDRTLQAEWVIQYQTHDGNRAILASVKKDFVNEQSSDAAGVQGRSEVGGPTGGNQSDNAGQKPGLDGTSGTPETNGGNSEKTPIVQTRRKRQIIREDGAATEQRPSKTENTEGLTGRKDSVTTPRQGQDATKLEALLKKLFNSPYFFDRAVTVVQDENDSRLPAEDRQSLSAVPGKVQGFYADGKVWLIAGNISTGRELAVLLHEVGVHMGMKNLLGKAHYDRLIKQLQMWEIDAMSGDNTTETQLITKARARLERAKKSRGDEAVRAAEEELGGKLPASTEKIVREGAKMSKADANEELLAYFVEEAVLAGINPSAVKGAGKLQQWFKSFMDAVKAALAKIGINSSKLTAKDIVNLAYGAAALELHGGEKGANPESRMFSINDPVSTLGQPDKLKAAVAKLPASLQGPALRIGTTIHDVLTRGLYGAAFGHDLVDLVAKDLPGAGKYFALMTEKETIETAYAAKIDEALAKAYSLPDKAAANTFLKRSTRSGKWGFKPAWNDKAVVDADTAKSFDALSTDAKEVVTSIFKQGHEFRTELYATIKAAIEAEFVGVDKDSMTPAEIKAVENSKLRHLRLLDKQLGNIDGPYAPLSRFGNFIAVAKSAVYKAAEDAKDKKRIAELESDPAHKAMFFADSLGEARIIAEEMQSKGYSADYFAKEFMHKNMTEAPWQAIQRLQTLVQNHFGNEEGGNRNVTRINALLKDLYLSTAAEASSRRHELHRRNIEGASDDMLRAFASKGRADAHFISALKNQGKVNQSLSDLRTAVATSTNKAASRRALNEIMERHSMSMEYNQTPLQDKAMALTSFWMLLTNPRYYAMNAMQTYMISVPYMAGKFGYARTAAETNKAYKDLVTGFAGAKGFAEGSFDIDRLTVSQSDKDFLHTMKAAGKLDIGINMDLGMWEVQDTPTSKFVHSMAHKTRTLARQVEVINRVSAGLAAFRLASQNGSADPTKYAFDVINRTHGDYTRMAAPKWLNKAPKVMTQFMKYKLIQWSLMARLGYDMFVGEERAAAAKSLAWMMGQSAVITGAMATPTAYVLMAIANALGGDDDDEDPRGLEERARSYIGDPTMADMILRGVPAAAGVDVSKYVGWEGVTNPVPFVAEDPMSRSGYAKSLMGLSGPFLGGLVPKMLDGIQLMASGDYYKGLEKVMPSLPSNAVRGFREATEGVTQRNGDIILDAEEVSFFDGMMQTLGLTPSNVADAKRNLNWARSSEQYFQDTTKLLRNQYAAAYRKGDSEGITAAREAWEVMQSAQRKAGIKPSKLSSLLKAPRAQEQREEEIADMVDDPLAEAENG